jgi:hypothetical protein
LLPFLDESLKFTSDLAVASWAPVYSLAGILFEMVSPRASDVVVGGVVVHGVATLMRF